MNKKNKFWIRTFAASLLCLASACSSGSKNIAPTAKLTNDEIFPLGVYQHDVQLEIKARKTGETTIPAQYHHFKGVVRLQADAIHIVGLSPFGTTVFEINDDFASGKVTDEIYVDRMKPFEDKLLAYYTNLKKLLTAKKAPGGDSPVIHLENGSTITFDQYDAHHIPEKLHLESPAFLIKIEVTGYDL